VPSPDSRSHPHMFFPFFYDPTYILLLPAMAFALWAQWRGQSTFDKNPPVRAANRPRGRHLARPIMQPDRGTHDEVQPVDGMLSDHYDPRSHTVRLSAENYAGGSIASIAVAAHEVGHVLQHHEGYVPLQLRSGIAPAVGIASTAAFPLFLIGLLIG